MQLDEQALGDQWEFPNLVVSNLQWPPLQIVIMKTSLCANLGHCIVFREGNFLGSKREVLNILETFHAFFCIEIVFFLRGNFVLQTCRANNTGCLQFLHGGALFRSFPPS